MPVVSPRIRSSSTARRKPGGRCRPRPWLASCWRSCSVRAASRPDHRRASPHVGTAPAATPSARRARSGPPAGERVRPTREHRKAARAAQPTPLPDPPARRRLARGLSRSSARTGAESRHRRRSTAAMRCRSPSPRSAGEARVIRAPARLRRSATGAAPTPCASTAGPTSVGSWPARRRSTRFGSAWRSTKAASFAPGRRSRKRPSAPPSFRAPPLRAPDLGAGAAGGASRPATPCPFCGDEDLTEPDDVRRDGPACFLGGVLAGVPVELVSRRRSRPRAARS